VPAGEASSSPCAACGASQLAVPGAQFTDRDLPLFSELERIVQEAALSKSEASLIAGELESVGLRWEPPELVLDQISPRLTGLRAVYDQRQGYSRLLSVIGMLLTIVCARLLARLTDPDVNRCASAMHHADSD